MGEFDLDRSISTLGRIGAATLDLNFSCEFDTLRNVCVDKWHQPLLAKTVAARIVQVSAGEDIVHDVDISTDGRFGRTQKGLGIDQFAGPRCTKSEGNFLLALSSDRDVGHRACWYGILLLRRGWWSLPWLHPTRAFLQFLFYRLIDQLLNFLRGHVFCPDRHDRQAGDYENPEE